MMLRVRMRGLHTDVALRVEVSINCCRLCVHALQFIEFGVVTQHYVHSFWWEE